MVAALRTYLRGNSRGFPIIGARLGDCGKTLLVVRLSAVETCQKAYRAICCSSSCILARLERFFGFGFGKEGSGVESFYKKISKLHFQLCLQYSVLRTLLNQSDISDLVEKSFSSCDCISRAANNCQILFPMSERPKIVPANLALLSSVVNDGLSPIARVPHHVKSCFIRRGSESPSLSMCL